MFACLFHEHISVFAFLLLLQQHPFFALHDSKETDVASFVKVILDD